MKMVLFPLKGNWVSLWRSKSSFKVCTHSFRWKLLHVAWRLLVRSTYRVRSTPSLKAKSTLIWSSDSTWLTRRTSPRRSTTFCLKFLRLVPRQLNWESNSQYSFTAVKVQTETISNSMMLFSLTPRELVTASLLHITRSYRKSWRRRGSVSSAARFPTSCWATSLIWDATQLVPSSIRESQCPFLQMIPASWGMKV